MVGLRLLKKQLLIKPVRDKTDTMSLTARSGLPRILTFDSGIGGLGIVQAIRELSPTLAIDYLADTAVFPYGEQDDLFLTQRIVTLISQAIDRLNPHLVVIACNTASTLALDALRAARPDMQFVGCVPPIRWAARTTQTGVIGLVATRATTRRPYLGRLHALYAPECTLIAHAAPGLATLAEKTFRGDDVSADSVRQEISGLFTHKDSDRLDTIGIGCTHYTFILDQLKAVSPPHITWLDPAMAVARQALTLLRAAPPPTDRPVPDQAPAAWFTAPPLQADKLLPRLTHYGYSDIRDWADDAPHMLQADIKESAK